MYENIKSCVRINNETSTFFQSNAEKDREKTYPPTILSLLERFRTFIISGGVNSIDFEVVSNESHIYLKLLILLYADDTIIFSDDKDNF